MLLVASLLTLSVLSELLVGAQPILLFAGGRLHVLPAVTAPDIFAALPTNAAQGFAVWPLVYSATTLDVDPSSWRALAGWWLTATRYVTTASLIIALVSTTLGLLLGWFATIERRVSAFALRHAVALCGSLPSLVLVGVARVSGRFPAGLDLILVLLVLRSIEATHLVRTLLTAAGEQDFVVSARVIGGSRWHVLSWHLMPHLSRPLASLAASTLASVVALEAALSLIGLAIPNHASWGVALVASSQTGSAAALLPALCAVLSLLALAAASVVLARQVRHDRWVEQRLV